MLLDDLFHAANIHGCLALQIMNKGFFSLSLLLKTLAPVSNGNGWSVDAVLQLVQFLILCSQYRFQFMTLCLQTISEK